jgi:hypothetical protein
MIITVQSFRQNPNTPMLAPGTEGIAIAVKSQQSKVLINGICRASKETTEKLSDSILHNSIIVCTYGPYLQPLIIPVIKEQVVFPDDISIEGNYRSAFFNIIISDCEILTEQGPSFFFAAFHTFLSETIKVTRSK